MTRAAWAVAALAFIPAHGWAFDGICVRIGGNPDPPGTAVIRGSVTSRTGEALRDVQITVDVVVDDGTCVGSFRREAKTDENGRYTVSAIRAGQYFVGAKHGAAPSYEHPYAPVYYPNSRTREGAEPFIIADGREYSDVNFVLPGPFARRYWWVRVVDAAGAPVENVRIQALDESGAPALGGCNTDRKGRCLFEGFAATTYRISSERWTDKTIERSQTKTLPAGSGDGSVELQLGEPAARPARPF